MVDTTFQGSKEKTARAVGVNLQISRKASYEIANAIRGKTTTAAISFLEDVALKHVPVPYKRFNHKVGHKRGMAAGRYPVNAAKKFLYLIRAAEKNAQDKGLITDTLQIVHVAAQQGEGQWRHGRQRRRQMKATHVEVVVQEVTQ